MDRRLRRVGPDTIAKILFTSGSTGVPKGVINTQRMLTSNQEIVRSILAFVAEEPPVLCDWMPWNHTFGGNHDFGFVLYNGGSLYIDEGKPTPGGIETTIRNLEDVAPTVYLNVPKGFEALLPFLRDRPGFRERFFSRLKLFYYAGAGISQPVWDELQRHAVAACGEEIVMFTGLGSTETGPAALFPGKDLRRAGDVGLPAPGVELKLVPREGKLEMRLRGPSITPGYWRAAGTDARRVRRRRLLQDRRRAAFCRSRRRLQGLRLRRPPGRGFQALHRHVGERGSAARAISASLLALGAGRGDRRSRPRRSRRR